MSTNWLFLTGPHDVQWLLDGHLNGVHMPGPVQSFILHGNEDSPKEIIVFREANPRIVDKPVARFLRSRRARGPAYYKVGE